MSRVEMMNTVELSSNSTKAISMSCHVFAWFFHMTSNRISIYFHMQNINNIVSLVGNKREIKKAPNKSDRERRNAHIV